MNRIIIPDYVNTVAKKLEEHGHECFIVGGCVRDALSGKKPHDFDMTTSATPDGIPSYSGAVTWTKDAASVELITAPISILS